MVPGAGLEPARPLGQTLLRRPRMPIPPPRPGRAVTVHATLSGLAPSAAVRREHVAPDRLRTRDRVTSTAGRRRTGHQPARRRVFLLQRGHRPRHRRPGPLTTCGLLRVATDCNCNIYATGWWRAWSRPRRGRSAAAVEVHHGWSSGRGGSTTRHVPDGTACTICCILVATQLIRRYLARWATWMWGRHGSLDRHSSTELGGCRCGWEAQPQAFRWFPELGTSLATLPVSDPLWLPVHTAGAIPSDPAASRQPPGDRRSVVHETRSADDVDTRTFTALS